MATLLFVHAHPDDECILTGSTLAKAKADQHRTIIVYGTRGDAGETNDDLGGESLGARRVREATAACAELGVDRVEWLPYQDSGMAGTETTSNPSAFSNANARDVAAGIGTLLAKESVDVIVGYDANGTYGHPDHMQVHAVAHASGALMGASWVVEATYSREYLAALPGSDGTLDPTFAAAEADLTHFVQGEKWLQAKLSAIGNHRSQIPDDFDADNPDIDGFRSRFGTEWFIATKVHGEDNRPLPDLFEPKAAWPGPLPK